jgi:hypothetical protein
MAIIHESYFTVSKHFPAYLPLIQYLFRNNPVFRETCIDFHKCSMALHYWSNLSSQEAPIRTQEYSALLQELKQELLQGIRLFNEDIAVNTQANKGENKQ